MQDATPPTQPETSSSNGSSEGSPRLRQLAANPLSQQERVRAEALAGQWKVLDLTAVPIEEKDVLTGEVEGTSLQRKCLMSSNASVKANLQVDLRAQAPGRLR